MERIQNLMDDLHKWADKTFGHDRKPVAAAYHLKKEVSELIEALEKKEASDVNEELADCFLLVLNVASKYGLNMPALLNWCEWKMDKNKQRSWGIPDENGVVEHIKNNEDGKKFKNFKG